MNDQRIAIITDSGTDTPADFCREHDVRVIPLQINFSDRSYESGVDIDSPELLRRMEAEIPKTSLPSPARIRQEFERAQADGYQAAVFVTLSSGLSATNQTAQLVASDMDFPVVVGDTLSIGVAAGLVVMETVRLVESGVPFDQLGPRIEELAHRTRVFFAVRDLKWLHVGGRISDPIYAIGKVLNIKPVLMCDPDDGHYIMAKKCRGWERALDTEVSLVAEHAKQFERVRLAVCCSDEEKLFEALEAKLRMKVEPVAVVESVTHSDVSPDLLVHTGPSLVGLGIMGC